MTALVRRVVGDDSRQMILGIPEYHLAGGFICPACSTSFLMASREPDLQSGCSGAVGYVK